MRSRILWSILIWWVAWQLGVAGKKPECKEFEIEQGVIEMLNTVEYDKTLLPPSKSRNDGVHGYTEPIDVELINNLLQILEVDGKSESMIVSLFLSMSWTDSRLAYLEWFEQNKECELPQKHKDGTDCVIVLTEVLWIPQIFLANAADGEFDFSQMTNALLYASGLVIWMPPALYKTNCALKVDLFPYDTQQCDIVFQSFYSREEVTLSNSPWLGSATNNTQNAVVDCAQYQANGEWDLKSAEAIQSPLKDTLTYQLVLRRKPLFYTMNLVIPQVLFFVLSWFEFYLPSQSGEKMTLSISILLGQTVFLFLIMARTPETSKTIPLIGAFLLFTMVMVTFSIMINVVICNVHFRTSATHVMTPNIKNFFIKTLAPWLGMRRPGQLPDFSKVANAQEDAEATSPETVKIPSYLLPTIDAVNYLGQVMKDEDEQSGDIDEWQYVAMILDRLCLWFYTSVCLLGTIYFAWKGFGFTEHVSDNTNIMYWDPTPVTCESGHAT